jgi:hypothetical protein
MKNDAANLCATWSTKPVTHVCQQGVQQGREEIGELHQDLQVQSMVNCTELGLGAAPGPADAEHGELH